MTVAHFHRTLTFCFFMILIAVITAILGIIAYLTFWRRDWELLLYIDLIAIILWLISVPICIFQIAGIFNDTRAIWVEDGVLHFHQFGELSEAVRIFSVDEKSVPLELIAGVTSDDRTFLRPPVGWAFS